MLLLIGFLFLGFIYIGIISLMIGMFPAVAFFNLPALSLFIVTLSFFLIVSKSGKILGKYIKSSFKKEYTYSLTELENLCTAVKNTIKFNIAAGLAGFLTFIVTALYFLDSPYRLGPNLAMGLSSVIYAVTISYFVFFPTQAWAENKINDIKRN